MRKLLFTALMLVGTLLARAQIEQTISLPVDLFGGSYQALLQLPNDYTTATTTSYPLLVFLHGAGESVPPLSTIYKSATAGGPAYFIEQGQWPVSFTNPADGKQYKFIVVSPQAAGSSWSSSGPQLNVMVQSLIKTYRVDVTRIYLTGLSAGGAGITQYVIHQDANGNTVTAPMYKCAAWVPMSQAFGVPSQAAMNVAVSDRAQAWGFGDSSRGGSSDIHGLETWLILNEMNNTLQGIARFTGYLGGHCCWGTYYNPGYRETINGKSMDIYEWMLQFTQTGNPPPGTVTPPVIPPVIPPVTPPVTPPGLPTNPVTGCHGMRKYLSPDPGDSSIYLTYTTTPSILQFIPGDTVCFKKGQGFGEVEFHGLTGTPACPIVVTNEGGQAFIKGYLKFYGAKYVHVDGGGAPGVKYGFMVQPDPNNITGTARDAIGLQITERSKCVEVNGVFINHTVFGMAIKQSPDCADSLNYPNWIMDSITIHDNYIRQVNLEGMYIGDTSPDNGPTSSDPRYVIGCHLPAVLDTIYPRPIRSGHMKIYNNIIDSTGRGGIQLSGHSVGIAEIYNNTLTHDGMNGDEQQGTGISIGMYSHAYIHDNTIRDNLTWSIASLGGSGTGVPLRIENNTMDSSGYLYHYANVNEQIWPVTPKMPVVSPSSGPNNYDFANPIFVKTATNMDKDSTIFWIKGNKIGKSRAAAVEPVASSQANIQVFDYAATPMFQKYGNQVCNNTGLDGVTPATLFVDAGINFTICGTITPPPPPPPPPPTPPVVSAGANQTITIPPASVTLTGSATAGGTAKILVYAWTKISGPGTPSIAGGSQPTATASGLQAGVYVFQLMATDDQGASGTAQVTITVQPAVGTCPVCPVCPVNPFGGIDWSKVSLTTAFSYNGHFFIQVSYSNGTKQIVQVSP